MKKFILLEFDDVTNNRLQSYVDTLGLKNDLSYSGKKLNRGQFRFHVTIMASTNSPTRFLPGNTTFTIPPITVIPESTGLIGDNIPCIFLEQTQELEELKLEMELGFGLIHRHDDFIPHISLSYNPYEPTSFEMPPPEFPIVANAVSVSNDIDTNLLSRYSSYRRQKLYNRKVFF